MRHGEYLDRDEKFSRWFHAHHARVLAQCFRTLGDRAEAEDVTQETLLRAWLGRERMREEDLGRWLAVVARNLCVSHMRRRAKAVPTEVLPDVPDVEADPARHAERAESRRALRRAMGEVSERHRFLFLRREVDGVEYGRLGLDIGLTAEGARTIAFRTRRVLRRHLQAVGEGLAGVVVGIRVRTRAALTRARTAAGSVEINLPSIAQSGLNAVLAVAIALGGTGGGAFNFVLRPQPAAVLAPIKVGSLQAPGRTSYSRGSVTTEDSSAASGAALHATGLAGKLAPKVAGPAWDPKTHSQDITVTIAGHEVWIQGGAGKERDVGDPAYPFIDAGVYAACSVSPRLCIVFIGH